MLCERVFVDVEDVEDVDDALGILDVVGDDYDDGVVVVGLDDDEDDE